MLHRALVSTLLVSVLSLNLWAADAKTAAPAKPTPAAETAPATSLYGNQSPLVPDWGFGILATVAGFPTPFRGTLEVKYLNMFGLSFEYGMFPTLTFSNISVGYKSWSATLKYYPFEQAMYIGVGFGQLTFSGSRTETFTISSVNHTATITMDATSTFINPHLGWRWIYESGFMWGAEIGVQVPMSLTTAITSSDEGNVPVNDPSVAATKQEIDDKAQTFANTPLPILGALQVGWMF